LAPINAINGPVQHEETTMKPAKGSMLKKMTPAQTKRYRADVAKEVAEHGNSPAADSLLIHVIHGAYLQA